MTLLAHECKIYGITLQPSYILHSVDRRSCSAIAIFFKRWAFEAQLWNTGLKRYENCWWQKGTRLTSRICITPFLIILYTRGIEDSLISTSLDQPVGLCQLIKFVLYKIVVHNVYTLRTDQLVYIAAACHLLVARGFAGIFFTSFPSFRVRHISLVLHTLLWFFSLQNDRRNNSNAILSPIFVIRWNASAKTGTLIVFMFLKSFQPSTILSSARAAWMNLPSFCLLAICIASFVVKIYCFVPCTIKKI